jgi:hypothetical protein
MTLDFTMVLLRIEAVLKCSHLIGGHREKNAKKFPEENPVWVVHVCKSQHLGE